MTKNKTIICLITLFSLLFTFPHAASALETSCETAIVIDLTTNTVLFDEKSEQRAYPAGLTKIMTAIVALEAGALDEIVTITPTMLEAAGSSQGAIKFKEGEQVSVLDLLYALLLASSNTAAYALSEYISGNPESFSTLMNAKAKAIGAESTNFTNPSGFHDENHYTTASDMAIISTYALQNARFAEIVNTLQYRIGPTNLDSSYNFYTDNHLVSAYKTNSYFYRFAHGIIPGYTSDAGYCLAAYAYKQTDGLELLAILMNGRPENKNDPIPTFKDAAKLFEECFNTFEIKKLLTKDTTLGETKISLGKTKDFVTVSAGEDFFTVLGKDVDLAEIVTTLDFSDTLRAPIEKGQELGTVTLTLDEKVLVSAPIYANYEIEASGFLSFIDKLSSFFGSRLFKMIFGVILLLIIVYIIFLIMINRRRQRMMSSRRRYRHRK